MSTVEGVHRYWSIDSEPIVPNLWAKKGLRRASWFLVTWDIYGLASNPTRRRILLSLIQGDKTFSDLMRSVSMDPEHQTGPFLYHVHRLEGAGLLKTLEGRYYLTKLGQEVAEDLGIVRHVLENRSGSSENPDSGGKLGLSHRTGQPGDRGGRIVKLEYEDKSSADESKMIVRPLEVNDVDSVLEVLYHHDFYRKQPDHIRGHLERVAGRGLDRNENNFVVEMDGRAIARLVVDTNYPPYAELAGLVVHPDYQGRGVGKALVTRFQEFAEERSVPIHYVMVVRDNKIPQGLYGNSDLYQGYSKDFTRRITRSACSDLPRDPSPTISSKDTRWPR
jgi:ribosomal protein S18 acetylase RimI-like enzyme